MKRGSCPHVSPAEKATLGLCAAGSDLCRHYSDRSCPLNLPRNSECPNQKPHFVGRNIVLGLPHWALIILSLLYFYPLYWASDREAKGTYILDGPGSYPAQAQCSCEPINTGDRALEKGSLFCLYTVTLLKHRDKLHC